MMFRGIGQAPDSAVTGTAAWLASVCAILSKDATFGPILGDPYAARFAEAISPEAPALLAQYDDEATRSAFIDERERDLPGALTVVAYRKPEMQRMALEALEATGASQLVIMGAGCDTLSARLAAAGVRPKVFEIDRPSVAAFRAGVLAGLPLELGHVTEVGVDFEHKTFGQALLENGYDPGAPAVFFAEGLLGYLHAEAVDELFGFFAHRSAPGSRFVFSFTENRRADAVQRIKTSELLDQQGEPPVFDLSPADLGAFVAARGLRLIDLVTAADLKRAYQDRHGGRIRVLSFLHLAVAGN
jgi:methyltransferase (TIGR00027 family)